MFRFFFVVLVMCGVLHAADDKLPIEAAQLVASYDAEVAKLKATYDAEVQKRASVVREKLVKVQEAATKKGNLDAALAVKATVEKLPMAPKEPKPINPVGTYKVSASTWAVGTITLKDDGKALAGNGDQGSWKTKADELIITWYNGNINKGKLANGSTVLEGVGGASMTITKKEE